MKNNEEKGTDLFSSQEEEVLALALKCGNEVLGLLRKEGAFEKRGLTKEGFCAMMFLIMTTVINKNIKGIFEEKVDFEACYLLAKQFIEEMTIK